VKIAVLGDIHANCFALRAVIAQLTVETPDAVILLGDTFGYYPWATETFRELRELDPLAILGNHDQLVLDAAAPNVAAANATAPNVTPYVWEIAQQNERDLASLPEALAWLRSLLPLREFEWGETTVRCCHGTPEDPLRGRYYPDAPPDPPWGPAAGEILLLGHTHYPLVRKTAGGGLIANPGSVGQPRDGDTRASWGLLYPQELRFEPRRTAYDVAGTIEQLEQLRWHAQAIAALRKNSPGRLRPPAKSV
jgi:predicted phosphodiesterase